MEINSMKNRKKIKGKGNEKPLDTFKPSVTKNFFCLLGNIFGIQYNNNNNNRDMANINLSNGMGQQRNNKPNLTSAFSPQSPISSSHSQSANSNHQSRRRPPTVYPPNSSKKSIFWAYVCWLFGGFFGLHLFYLERDAHAFLTWSTLGGYGLGWLADITKIPRYVRDCNNDPRFLDDLIQRMRRNRKPPFSTSRFISALMVGYLWGQLILLAIPQNELFGINWNTYLHWFIPLAVALGVWVVGNIGREQGSPWLTIAASYGAYTTRWYFYDENIWLSAIMFAAALTFDSFSKEWRRQPRKQKSFIQRIVILSVCAAVYMALWSSYLYFNGTITDSNGDEVPIHEALHHFFTSPWWTDLKQSLYDTYQYAQHHGWYEIWKQIIELSDPQGEQNAYRVLGVSPTASQQEITTKWRALSRENHPDKCKDPEKQKEVQERFLEIQQAYEILSNIKNKRRQKNKKYVVDD